MSTSILRRWRRIRSGGIADHYHQVCDLLLASERTVVLTGAGVSTRSGIPDFRSPQSGIWSQFDPMTVASIWGFRDQPERFYEWIRPFAAKILSARPNPAHQALAALEQVGLVDLVVTQNIDSLHQQAGSRQVVHVHGSAEGAVCLACGYREDSPRFWAQFLQSRVPPKLPLCARCASVLKPDVILFGEELPPDELMRAQQAALNCDLMLVAGTSLEVMPAADLPLLARRRGAKLAVLNLGHTMADHCADVIVREELGVSLPHIARLCLEKQRDGALPAL